MTTNEIKSDLDGYKEQVDVELEKIISSTTYTDDFKEILHYAVFPGGKRLRPVLLLLSHSVFSQPDEYALRVACGLELIHSYSLIHDDMPCMDNDDMRRGKPTVHKKFGEGKALLAGDALLDLGYRTLTTPSPRGETPAFCYFANLLGDNGLISGQYRDLYRPNSCTEDLFSVYKEKTGALISLCCILGYTLGNNIEYNLFREMKNSITVHLDGSEDTNLPNEQSLLDYIVIKRYGESFGVAFQLYDDITEYINGEAVSKTSILNFVDLDEAKRMLNKRLNDAAKALDMLNVRGNTEPLRELLNFFVVG